MKEKTGKFLSLDSISGTLILISIFLLPLFFIPYMGISLTSAKMTLLSLLVVTAFLLWLVARIKTGELTMPKSIIVASMAVVTVVFFVSALFSPAIKVSLFGLSGDISTASSFLILFLLMFLGALFFQTIKKTFYVYAALLISFLFIAIFHIIRLAFGPDILSFGLFNSSSASVVGSWNDFAVFAGLIALLSLTTLQLLSVPKYAKVVLYSFLTLAVLFLAIINFSLVWLLVGVFGLIVFVYSFSFGRINSHSNGEPKESNKTAFGSIPLVPLLVIIIAILFLLPGDLGRTAGSVFNIPYAEVRPSWSATVDIASDTLKDNPILGSGPNRFNAEWLLHKPEGINQTLFWNTDFVFGIGMIPSFAVMLGILGILAFLVFLFLFIFYGGRAALSVKTDNASRYITFSSFILALYLWSAAFFYIPGIVSFSFAFIFTGVFIAALTRDGKLKNYTISFVKDPRTGFVSVLVLVILLIAFIVAGYFFTQRFMAEYSFAKGARELNISGDISSAESYVSRALALYEYDTYLRSLSGIQVAKLGAILGQTGASEDTVRAQFQETLGDAISSAQRAVAFDETNYINWISLGSVYEAVIPIGINGAYENALASYERALSLNQQNPAMNIILARNELARGNSEVARVRIAEALAKKPDYTEAIFLLSQIEVNEGNLNEAIRRVEEASFIAPNNIGIFFQLGLLRYNIRDYTGAISALERAVILNPVYANAKYFLGLSYDRVERTTDAIAQFEDIELLNPNNAEVERILSNLRAGRNPLDSVPPPAPEDREEPPIEEEG